MGKSVKEKPKIKDKFHSDHYSFEEEILKDEFYEKFEKVRTKLDMPEVSMKLVCITNMPLKDVPAILPPCNIKSTLP